MLKIKNWWLSDAEYGRLNPPIENAKMIKDEIWYQRIDDPNWLPVGYIPTPNGIVGWFFYHFIHGVWMKYPLWSVVLFCLDKDNYPNINAAEHRVNQTAGTAPPEKQFSRPGLFPAQEGDQ